MYICTYLYTCASAQVLCAFPVARSSTGQWPGQAGVPAAECGCWGPGAWAESTQQGLQSHTAQARTAEQIWWQWPESAESPVNARQVHRDETDPKSGWEAKPRGQSHQTLQGDSDKEEQGPEMRLLPALSPVALCVDPNPHAHGWGGGRGCRTCDALRVMKIMEKCRVVSNCQWGPITKLVEIILLSSPLSSRSGLPCTFARCWGFLVTVVKQLLLPIV